MQKSLLKGVAIAAAVSIGALAAAPQAHARNDHVPAIIAGIALGAIIASQSGRHHRRHDYYERDRYAPDPYYYDRRHRYRGHVRRAPDYYRRDRYRDYYPPTRHYNQGGYYQDKRHRNFNQRQGLDP